MKDLTKHLKQTLEKSKSLVQKRKVFNNKKRKELIQKFKNSVTLNLNEFKFNQIKENILLTPKKFFSKSQNYLDKKFSLESQKVLLKQPRTWAIGITWSLISGTIFGIGWLAIAKTDEVVIASGKLEPISGVVDVQVPINGIAEEILVAEGDYVNKGQILIKLDTELSQSNQVLLNQKLEISRDILNRLEMLVSEGAVSEIQYLQQKTKVNEIENEIKKNKVNLKYQEINSPINGIVFNLKPQNPGYVSNRTEPLMKIVPTDKLHASVEISSQYIGFVEVGKQAEISIDSFPSSDFGVLLGEIAHIGSDALPPNPALGQNYRFPADIKLKSQYLESKGKKLPLQVGMSLTANIKLRKVSYLELLLSTFKQKTDSLKAL
tara:strand:+ start:5525 stop:6658 length:1134 start_codon:yes stop_codon:yes gene_type:complete